MGRICVGWLAIHSAGDNLVLMAIARAWAVTCLAATLCVVAALLLPGSGNAHPGHGVPVASPATDVAAATGMPSHEVARLPRGGLEDALSVQPQAGKKAPTSANCARSCCVGGTPCAGAYALDLPFVALAPPGGERALRHVATATGEGIHPQALPEPPRSKA